jgi:protein subunit release factor A
MADARLWADVDIRVMDQRIGVGVGGRNTIIRLLHKPTGIIIEMPHITNDGSHKMRALAMSMLEYGLLEADLLPPIREGE